MRLTPEGGVPGDAWARDCPAKVESQITVMQLGVAKLIAGEQPLTLFGGDALRLTADRRLRDLRLRGIHLKVVEAGEIRLGGLVEVLNRG